MEIKLIISKTSKLAFTLAEVLVTLAVIGIVASVTIPSLVQNMQEQQYRNAFKKTYSDMAQVATIMIGEGNFSDMCKQHVSFSDQLELNFFKVVNRCGPSYSMNCNYSTFNYKSLNGEDVNRDFFDDGQFILLNGQFVMLENPFDISPNPVCIAWIDVNGLHKGPNTLGKDVFGVQFLQDKLVLMGASETISYFEGEGYNLGGCSSAESSDMSGLYCAKKVILNEDY